VTRRPVFLAALACATLVRLLALPLPGTEDVGTWKIWAYGASSHVTYVYGVGGTPPVRGVVTWNQHETTVDYPPAAMYELALVGFAYRAIDPSFADGGLLNAMVKIPGLLAGAMLTWLLAWTARRFTRSASTAAWAALAYWLNPATVLNAEVLGYLDPLMMLPAVAALVLLHVGAAESAGVCFAVALLTKPQAILVGPALALAAWHMGSRSWLRAGGGAALAAIVLVLPFAITGALPNMWLAFGSFYARRDILSGNAANVWWIANYLSRAWNQRLTLGARAFFQPVHRIMAISTFQEQGFPNPRPFATAAAMGVAGFGIWRLRHNRDLASHALATALSIHAFCVLSVGVHENHLIFVVPFLTLAAALQPSIRPLFYAVSAIAALNLNLFYGIGRGWGYSLPRMMLGIDLSVLLSLANIAALVWHARVVSRIGKVTTAQPSL
jgi:Glycosyltransferase family 87